MTQSFYRGSDAAVVVFDLSCKKSFDDLEYWLKSIKTECENCPIILIGNKCDLSEQREAENSAAQKLVTETPAIIRYIETSAKEDSEEAKISDAFLQIAKYLNDIHMKDPGSSSDQTKLVPVTENRNCYC